MSAGKTEAPERDVKLIGSFVAMVFIGLGNKSACVGLSRGMCRKD